MQRTIGTFLMGAGASMLLSEMKESVGNRPMGIAILGAGSVLWYLGGR